MENYLGRPLRGNDMEKQNAEKQNFEDRINQLQQENQSYQSKISMLKSQKGNIEKAFEDRIAQLKKTWAQKEQDFLNQLKTLQKFKEMQISSNSTRSPESSQTNNSQISVNSPLSTTNLQKEGEILQDHLEKPTAEMMVRLEKWQAKYEKAQSEISNLKAKISTLNSQRTNIEDMFKQKIQQMKDSSQAELTTYTSQNTDLQIELSEWKNKYAQLDKQVKDLQGKIDKGTFQNQADNTSISQSSSSSPGNQFQITQEAYQALKNELDSLQTKISVQNSQKKNIEAAFRDSINQLKKKQRDQNKKYVEEINELQGQLKDWKEKHNKINQKFQDMEQRLINQSKKSQSSSTRETMSSYSIQKEGEEPTPVPYHIFQQIEEERNNLLTKLSVLRSQKLNIEKAYQQKIDQLKVNFQLKEAEYQKKLTQFQHTVKQHQNQLDELQEVQNEIEKGSKEKIGKQKGDSLTKLPSSSVDELKNRLIHLEEERDSLKTKLSVVKQQKKNMEEAYLEKIDNIKQRLAQESQTTSTNFKQIKVKDESMNIPKGEVDWFERYQELEADYYRALIKAEKEIYTLKQDRSQK